MPKTARYPIKVEVWAPESFARGLELLAKRNPLMSVSDHARAALAAYLMANGISIVQQLNGQHQEDRNGMDL